jgi:hypothetical protein
MRLSAIDLRKNYVPFAMFTEATFRVVPYALRLDP